MRENSRESLSEISRVEGIPMQKLAKELGRLERGAIKRYACLVDAGSIGYNLRVYFFCELVSRRDGEELLNVERCINSCARLEGNRVFLECFFWSMRELADFRERLSRAGARIIDESFAVEELKREGFVCD